MRFDKIFLKYSGRRMLWQAALTAAIVFLTSLSLNIQKAEDITRLTIISSLLAALAAFLQTFHEAKKS